MSAAPDNQAVLAALSRVQEPELHRDLVSLGMIKDLTLDAGRVGFTIELTTPACPVKDEMKAQAEQMKFQMEQQNERLRLDFEAWRTQLQEDTKKSVAIMTQEIKALVEGYKVDMGQAGLGGEFQGAS